MPARPGARRAGNWLLRPGIGVMCQLVALVRLFVAVALRQGHVQSVQDEPCLLRQGGGGPADDAAGEGVHDEGDRDEGP